MQYASSLYVDGVRFQRVSEKAVNFIMCDILFGCRMQYSSGLYVDDVRFQRVSVKALMPQVSRHKVPYIRR
jgi:hypothetical protein